MKKVNTTENQPSPLRAEVEYLRARKEELRTELASVIHKLEVLSPALRILEGTPDNPATPGKHGPVNWDDFDLSRLNGLSKIDYLVEMARFAGGTVNIKDVGPLLLKAGVIEVKHPYQATAKAYTALYSSHRFKKSGPGIFTLIEE